ncbi:MAG: hypothetical protein CMC90_03205 [Flavobacteriaceae bacterium]|nr:hypothetical protein [Flavobacteriaceae bacterium]
MSIAFRIIILLIFISCNSSASESPTVESDNITFSIINEKILFIGNSFTYYWNLPSQVEKMSIERGLNWNIKHLTAPSATLKIHWNNPELKSILESETFDHIIFQEHSTNILTNSQGNSKFYFDQISSLIPSTTQIHFFSTWMYPSMEQFNINNEEYPIEESIKEIIEGTTAKIIPIGRAFKLFQDKYPQFNLLMEDDKHPSPNGSYLASCIIFSHISAESSLNLSRRFKGTDNKGVDIYYSIVEEEVKSFLQQISDEVTF